MKETIETKMTQLDAKFNLEQLTAEFVNDRTNRMGCDGCDGGCRGGGFSD